MSKTDEQLAKILQKGIEVAEKSGHFIIEQAPDLIQQLIIWKSVSYIFNILVGLSLLYACYQWYKMVKNKIEKNNNNNNKGILWDEDFEDYPGLIIGGLFIVIISISILFISIHNLIQIIIAPKIWLIEYTMNLIK